MDKIWIKYYTRNMKKIFFICLFLCLAVVWSGAVVIAPSGRNTVISNESPEQLRKRFWAAVEGNDLREVKKCIRKDKRLVWDTKKGMTPYLTAVKKGNKPMAWELAENFSRPLASCVWGNAAHIAVDNQDFGMLKLVIKVAQIDGDDMVDRMLNQNRISAKPGQRKADLNTPLHLAALNCDRPMYEYIVSFGGSEKVINADFKTPKDILDTCPPEKAKASQPEKKD